MAADRVRRSSIGVIEIARDLGVSTATVSRALNGSPVVRAELADRIRAHTESKGYVANRLARALSATTNRAFVGSLNARQAGKAPPPSGLHPVAPVLRVAGSTAPPGRAGS